MPSLGSIASAPWRIAGCNRDNVFHSNNRKAWGFGTTILMTGLAFHRYGASRFGSGFNWAARTLTIGGIGADAYLNRCSKLNTLAAESKARTAFITQDDDATKIDANKLNKELGHVNNQLDRVYKYRHYFAFDTDGRDVKNPTTAGLIAALKNQATAYKHFRDWAIGGGMLKMGSNSWGVWASDLAHSMKLTVQLLLTLDNLPLNNGAERPDKGKETLLRTPAQVRQYIEQGPDRKALAAAINAYWNAFSLYAGDACKKPDGARDNPGYNPSVKEIAKVQEALLKDGAEDWITDLVTTYNEAVTTSSLTATLLRSNQEVSTVGGEFKKDTPFALAPFAEGVKAEQKDEPEDVKDKPEDVEAGQQNQPGNVGEL